MRQRREECEGLTQANRFCTVEVVKRNESMVIYYRPAREEPFAPFLPPSSSSYSSLLYYSASSPLPVRVPSSFFLFSLPSILFPNIYFFILFLAFVSLYFLHPTHFSFLPSPPFGQHTFPSSLPPILSITNILATTPSPLFLSLSLINNRGLF